jgi:AraC-like DNA-binding protein
VPLPVSTSMPATDLHRRLAAAGFLVDLMERLPDVVFFAKDTEGRYQAVNETLVRRLGRRSAAELLGKTTRDLFPAPLGQRFLAQDLRVIHTGEPVVDLLELHLYPDRHEGWCVTTKLVIRNESGEVLGLAGTSRDLRPPSSDSEPMGRLAQAVWHLQEHYGEPLRVADLAERAGLSLYQLARRIRLVFGLTTAQLIAKTRLDAARRQLAQGDEPIAEIAAACGFCDQAALTRQFKAAVGLTPAQYREHSARRKA